MRFLSLLLAFVFAATSAQAQTDDRVLNDVLKLLGADHAVSALGQRCAELTGNDPAVAAAFAGWSQRNSAMRISAVVTIGMRGGLPPEAVTTAQDEARALFFRNLDAASDQPDWCRRSAADIDKTASTASMLYPAEAARMADAARGNLPVLDLATSEPVADAVAVRQIFFYVEALMRQCHDRFEQRRSYYKDGYSYWRSRNFDAEIFADKIMQNWGAQAPHWSADAKARAEAEALTAFADPAAGEARCVAFVTTVKDGAEDIPTRHPELFARLERDAEIVP